MITAVDTTGQPTSPQAKTFVDLITGNPQPRPDILQGIIKRAKFVPKCAMQVTRAVDGGDLSLNPSPTPCDCYFEFTATGSAPASCTTCANDSQCSTGHCRLGFCEVR
jgi:hypothetical protein